ncbi:unnamed protein product [Amoebophrya sp. A25]|nr:unnamed protein product [Amoebophrya sp. A25]|eukprot:GSA25T00020945001.1
MFLFIFVGFSVAAPRSILRLASRKVTRLECLRDVWRLISHVWVCRSASIWARRILLVRSLISRRLL